MLNKIAVTGGLSCGKSTVCRFFKEFGAYVVSADAIVHQLLSPKTPIGRKVIKIIGEDIVVNGQIDRTKIAKKVFNDQTLLQSLEGIIHPGVLQEIEREYHQACKEAQVTIFVAEIPLLFERDLQKNFDYTIAVVSDPKICRQRFKQATGYSDKEYDDRMAQQMSVDNKIKYADYVIQNNGNLEKLREEVHQIVTILTSKINP